jgi:acyl carrier protein
MTTATKDDEILTRLNTIFRDVLDDDDVVLTPATVADDVEGWDSLAHVRLMLTVERAFSLKFTAAQVGRLKNVGDLVALIADRLP